MHSKRVAGTVARISLGLLVLGGGFFLLAIGELNSMYTGAMGQEQGRLVARKPWRVEPVKVVSAKTKKRGKIEIGKAFDAEDDWLDGFAITVQNGSDKIVTALTIEMIFPRDVGDTRKKFLQELHFGPSPFEAQYTNRDPNKVIKPGETVDLEVEPQTYNSIEGALQKLGYPNSIKRIELTIREVGFEDGSALLSGTLYAQDPNNPSDPTKKIRPDKLKPPGPRNHRISTLPDRKSAMPKKL